MHHEASGSGMYLLTHLLWYLARGAAHRSIIRQHWPLTCYEGSHPALVTTVLMFPLLNPGECCDRWVAR